MSDVCSARSLPKLKLEFDLVFLGQTIRSAPGNLGFQSTRLGYGTAANRDLSPTTCTIKRDRGKIVVRPDQPEPTAFGLAGELLDSRQQMGRHARALLK